jgi:hypothetical protein
MIGKTMKSEAPSAGSPSRRKARAIRSSSGRMMTDARGTTPQGMTAESTVDTKTMLAPMRNSGDDAVCGLRTMTTQTRIRTATDSSSCVRKTFLSSLSRCPANSSTGSAEVVIA